jgi:multicomponent Na+:H+ antiporter subunit D
MMRPITRRRALQLGGLGLAATVVGGCGPPAPGRSRFDPVVGDPLAEPPVLRSRGGVLQVRLEAAEARVPLAGWEAATLAYNGSLPGPTLHVQPGDRLRIELVNRLAEPTNLHVHGTYRVTGTLAMRDVAERMAGVDPNAALLIATGFIIAFSVKLGLFPFHFWLPTVYPGSSPAVAAILSGAVANIGAYGLLRFGPTMFPAQLRLVAAAIVVLGAVSLVYGAVLAVARGDVAESLAYSAIGQVGYVLVALGVGGPVGLTAAVVYSAVNALNKTLLFLAGPLVAGAFAVGALSVAGVPPAAGFVGKLEMFRAGIVVGSVPLVVLLIVGSGLSLVYMFQMYQRSFWRALAPAGPASPLPLRLLTTAVALIVLAAGVWPEPLLAASGRAAEALLTGAPG